MLIAAVARLVGVQATTVGKWRRAFAAERMAGLEDAGWIGRPKADLILDDAERRQLQQWARQARTAQFLVLRATDRAALRFAPSTSPRIDKAVPAGLDVHLVCDNYATHNTAEIRTWLGKHPASTSTSPPPAPPG